jgi:hypothetical protein
LRRSAQSKKRQRRQLKTKTLHWLEVQRLLEACICQLTKGNSDRAFEEFDFAENQLAKLDAQGQQDLIDLIDEVYQDGVEKLVAAL